MKVVYSLQHTTEDVKLCCVLWSDISLHSLHLTSEKMSIIIARQLQNLYLAVCVLEPVLENHYGTYIHSS